MSLKGILIRVDLMVGHWISGFRMILVSNSKANNLALETNEFNSKEIVLELLK